jgi:hypothetical protein
MFDAYVKIQSRLVAVTGDCHQPASILFLFSLFVKIAVELYAVSQVYCFTYSQGPCCFKDYFFLAMIGVFIVTRQTCAVDKLIGFGLIGCWYLIFRIDRVIWTFGNTGAAVNTCVWVNVIGWPLLDWGTRVDAFHRAYVTTSVIAQT